jgi:hypothetical protein
VGEKKIKSAVASLPSNAVNAPVYLEPEKANNKLVQGNEKSIVTGKMRVNWTSLHSSSKDCTEHFDCAFPLVPTTLPKEK